MNDAKRGIYGKYKVERTDGSSGPGMKHDGCSYFVLDLEHDEFAIPALKAYAKACREQYPDLAEDLELITSAKRSRCSCREASCPHSFVQAFEGPSPLAAKLMAESRRGK